MSIDIQESAIATMARGEVLTGEQLLGLSSYGRTADQLELSIGIYRDVPGLQKMAGTSADREADAKRLAELRASVATKRAKIERQIEQLTHQIEKDQIELENAEDLVRSRHVAVERLIIAVERDAVPHITEKIKAEEYAMASLLRSLNPRRDTLRKLLKWSTMEVKDQYDHGEPNSLYALADWLRDQKFGRKLFDDSGRIVVDQQVMHEARGLMLSNIERLQSEVESLEKQEREFIERIDQLKRHLVPS